MTLRALIRIIGSLVLCCCWSLATFPAQAEVEVAPAQVAFHREFLAQLNEVRDAHDLPELSASPALDCIALWHTQDMVARDFFAHTTPEGTTMADRYRRATGTRPPWLAENLAAGYVDAAEVLQIWLDSPGHRANLLHPRMRVIGLGALQDPAGTKYNRGWTVTLLLSSMPPQLTTDALAECPCASKPLSAN